MSDVLKEDFLGSVKVMLDPQYLMEERVLETGAWEPHVLLIISALLKGGDTAVDVGANVGLHTLAMAQLVGETGSVIAFEPSDLCHPRLKTNFGLNPDLNSRVEIEKLCLSDESGDLKLFQSGDGSNAYVDKQFNEKLWNRGGPEDYQAVKAVTLDEYLAGKTVDLMKVDVEGMELEVFRGATKTLKESKPTIIFETLMSDFDQAKIKATETLLRNNGYLIFGFFELHMRLGPVMYPHLLIDSVAIHRDKLPSLLNHCGKFFLDFTIYEAELQMGSLEGQRIELYITKTPDVFLYARFQVGDRVASLHSPGMETDDKRQIKNSHLSWKCNLNFLDDTQEEFTGELAFGPTPWPIRGKKLIASRS